MNGKNKRFMAILLAVLALVVVLGGCSGKNGNNQPASSPSPTGSEAGQSETAPAASAPMEEVTLELFQNFSWVTYPEWGSNEVTRIIKEKTGITLKFTKPTTDDNQQLNLMLASGELPDFVVNDIQNPTYKKSLISGVFEDLGPLMDQYAPELRERLGEEYWKMNAAEDGKNYAFVNAEMRPSNLDKYLPVGPWNPVSLVREDIYEALGKPKLDTPDDLYNVLMTVKEKYPDVTPIVIGDSKFDFDMQPAGYQYLFANFGIEKYYEKDGKLTATYKAPNYLPALKWMNKLYNSGLITRSDMTATPEQRKAIIDAGNAFFRTGEVSTGYQTAINNPDVRYVYVKPFADTTILQQGSIGWLGWSISKNSKHKEAAIRLMSYMLSDEGQKLTNFGIEGRDWEMNGDTPVRTEQYYENVKADPNYNANTGIGIYWFNLDLYDHWIQAGEMQKNPEQKEAMDLYLPHKNLKFYMLNLLPEADTEEAVILQKVKTQFNAAFPTFLMAKDEAETERLYNEFVAKADEAGMPKVEALWDKNSQKMKEIFK